MKLRKSLALATAALVLAGAGGAARAASVDYVGFAWETGGLAVSQPGDQLSVATVVTQIDPLFEVNLGTHEATLYIDGLQSTGAAIDGMTGNTIISYSGGTIAIYADPSPDHDWGTYPANGTVPSTFTDGSLVFSGVFTSFTVIISPAGYGVYEGFIDGTGGSAVAGPCSNCAYTFSGTFGDPTGAQIPDGYDLQVDGSLEVENTVASEDVSWGSLKQLFNPNR
ncbi:MAG TPA: hypothetical protein PLQ13_11315 [Candidatus Krumholzibacteria bacterium]|nr:hypothetical protein [Candidatus Krumholzibacteria bacterium]